MTFKPYKILAVLLCIAVMMLTGTVTASAAGDILGDADGDGRVTIIDATTIQRTLAGLNVTRGFSKNSADVNRSGNIEITDATLIQRWLVNMASSFPIGTQVEEPTEPPIQRPTDEEGWGRDVIRP